MDEDKAKDSVERLDEESVEEHHDVVMATARRIIARDAAILHRLGTV